MATEGHPLIFDERFMRYVFASAVTLVALGAVLTRSTPAVDWSLLAPTVLVVWAWAAIDRFPRALVYLSCIVVPLVLNLVDSDPEASMFLAILAVAIIASHETPRVTTTIVVPTMAITFILGLTAIDSFGTVNWLLGLAFSWGAGAMVYRYSTTIDELEQARRLIAEQAAVHERRRIARDVHDLVGHSLSVVMLHVTGARHLVHKDPVEAERALEQAEAAGRESLAEIRRTVGMLRDDMDTVGTARPSPGLADVRSLVDEFLVAGVDVTLDVQGDVRCLDGSSSLAGYRIIQEALTNASRHTVDATVQVAIAVGETSFDLEVVNQGGTTVDLGKETGFGLVSMRERARSVGGLLVAGPTPGGWTVEATLPIRFVNA